MVPSVYYIGCSQDICVVADEGTVEIYRETELDYLTGSLPFRGTYTD